jgi:hypothetical protein
LNRRARLLAQKQHVNGAELRARVVLLRFGVVTVRNFERGWWVGFVHIVSFVREDGRRSSKPRARALAARWVDANPRFSRQIVVAGGPRRRLQPRGWSFDQPLVKYQIGSASRSATACGSDVLRCSLFCPLPVARRRADEGAPAEVAAETPSDAETQTASIARVSLAALAELGWIRSRRRAACERALYAAYRQVLLLLVRTLGR